MTKLTDSEWRVMQVLWEQGPQSLGHIVEALAPETGWSRTTVHTYLTRMTAKGLVEADSHSPRHYFAAVTRQACADDERRGLVRRAYQGSAGKLVAAFVQDGSLTREEREQLRLLLDEMEV